LADLGRLTALRSLDLRDNHLEFVPSTLFAQWTNMERLWLSHNKLTVIPADDVEHMAHTLEELHLSYNRLESLPAEMAKLTRLKVLTVEENRIVELPAQLGSMTRLERLEVGTQNGQLRCCHQQIAS
jgi:Leucine-rich repeat (LRR) protein